MEIDEGEDNNMHNVLRQSMRDNVKIINDNEKMINENENFIIEIEKKINKNEKLINENEKKININKNILNHSNFNQFLREKEEKFNQERENTIIENNKKMEKEKILAIQKKYELNLLKESLKQSLGEKQMLTLSQSEKRYIKTTERNKKKTDRNFERNLKTTERNNEKTNKNFQRKKSNEKYMKKTKKKISFEENDIEKNEMVHSINEFNIKSMPKKSIYIKCPFCGFIGWTICKTREHFIKNGWYLFLVILACILFFPLIFILCCVLIDFETGKIIHKCGDCKKKIGSRNKD